MKSVWKKFGKSKISAQDGGQKNLADFDVVGKKTIYFLISAAVIVLGIFFLIKDGLPLGIDFTGGTLWELRFETLPAQEQLKKTFGQNQVEVFSIVTTPESFIIKTLAVSQEKNTQIKAVLVEEFGQVEEVRFETVGPTISAELSRKAIIALLLAVVAIVVYISWAFRRVPQPATSASLGIIAIVALLHDTLIVVGSFAVLGHFGAAVDSLFVTALLTVLGFSVHDTIVVFDRIRENLTKLGNYPFSKVVNYSILQTIGRSLNTSITLILVLVALLLFGGVSIRWFVVALLIGIISGTYSSIFTASPLLVVWQEFVERRRKA